MRVVKEFIGTIYRGPCIHCKSIIELDSNELKLMHKQIGLPACPVCHNSLWIDPYLLQEEALYREN